MDGWWTFARGSTTLHACLSTRRDKSNDAVTLDANDRSHGSMTWSARSSSACGVGRAGEADSWLNAPGCTPNARDNLRAAKFIPMLDLRPAIAT